MLLRKQGVNTPARWFSEARGTPVSAGRILAKMSERFYVNSQLVSGPLVLQGAEAHHLATVRRLRPGARICLFNGDGREYPATIAAAGRGWVDLKVQEGILTDRELVFQLTVACPLPKGDRGQVLIEKLTELGVTRYVPLRTRRSVVHPGDGKAEKLHRYVIEASKQCGRNVLMKIEDLCPWNDYLRHPALPVRRLLAHFGGSSLPGNQGPMDTAIAVGPEGGFTPEEMEAAQAAGWQLVDLGPRTLRIETAALALVSALTL